MKLSIKIFLPIIIIIHTIIWYVAYYFLAAGDIYGYYTGFMTFIFDKQGEFYSTLLMTLLSFNILLAARFKFLENIFSGLDKVYVAHKYSAYLIFILIILHNTLIPESRNHYSGFFFLAKEVAGPLMFSFFALIILSALPHIPFVKKFLNIPYHIWKYTHYLMGLLFLVGIYHSIGVRTLTFSNPTLSLYMYIVYTVGALALIYKSFFYNLFKNKNNYYLNSKKIYEKAGLVKLSLLPRDKKDILNWRAGQFAFFKFVQDGLIESHPFTISNSYNEKGEIRLSIKGLGDYTKKLIDELQDGIKIKVAGPYGRFISDKSKNNLEIWVAGGIGITPFLAMLEEYKKENTKNNISDKNILFVWSVRDESEAVYKEEIEKELPSNINFILHDTSKSGYFKFTNLENEIKARSVNNNVSNSSLYICGPVAMREAIVNDAKKLNITDIHFEEFNFR